MKVHLRQIPPDGLHLEGEEDCPIPELEKDEVFCAGPLRYALDVGISEGSLWASGSLSQPVEVACVACLERFVHTINVPDFALHQDLAGPETIDLAPFVREDLLLNLPAYPHCDRDGGRVCPAPQNLPPRTELDEAVEKARKPDWSALDKLEL
ncbi:MAG: YceD family protein [Chthoniobacterales bacterium]